MTTREVEVKREHIDRGRRGDGHACPVALAINETLEQGEWTGVAQSRVTLYRRSGEERYEAEPELIEWLTDYDKGLSTAPATLQLEGRGEQQAESAGRARVKRAG